MNTTEAQEKLNAYNRKKTQLKQKAWFRAIEVAYWIALSISSLFVLMLSIDLYDGFDIFFWGTVIIAVAFIAIKKLGYYILIGNINIIKPDFEDTLDSKLKK